MSCYRVNDSADPDGWKETRFPVPAEFLHRFCSLTACSFTSSTRACARIQTRQPVACCSPTDIALNEAYRNSGEQYLSGVITFRRDKQNGTLVLRL